MNSTNSGQPETGKTIFLIDNEESIRTLGYRALTRVGHRVLLAKDGLEAVETFKNNHSEIDLVLLDLVMPQLNGADCFEQLEKIDSKVRVVLMSGIIGENNGGTILKSDRCFHVLRKPFGLSDLIGITNKALSDR